MPRTEPEPITDDDELPRDSTGIARSPAQRARDRELAEKYAPDEAQQAALAKLVQADEDLDAALALKAKRAQERAEAIADCLAKDVSWNRMSTETGKARPVLQRALERGD